MIYNFICRICKDKKIIDIYNDNECKIYKDKIALDNCNDNGNQNELNENKTLDNIKRETIEDILEKIYTYTFENRLEEIITSSEITKFLYNPSIYVFERILKELNNKFETIQKEINIVESYNEIKYKIGNSKSNLIAEAKKENLKLFQDFINEQNVINEEELKNRCKDIKSDYNNYNKIYEELKEKGEKIESKIKSEGHDYLKIRELINEIYNKKMDKNIEKHQTVIKNKVSQFNKYLI